MVAIVGAQALLVSCSTKCRLTRGFFKLEEAIADEVLLTQLIEGEHTWRSELDFGM
jgi:hypothetical protein